MVTGELVDVEAGLLGPASVTWQVHSDPAMWIAGIRSLYLQALHPRAVAGVVQNSDYRGDPLGRLRRTAEYVATTTYGSRGEAEAAGERVRRVHRNMRATDPDTGRSFRIDEPELLLWVHCSEVFSFADVVRLAGMPLDRERLDRYFAEQCSVAALVGLDPETVPGSLTGMQRYFARMRPLLRAGSDAAAIDDFLHRPPVSGGLRLGLGVYERLLGHVAYSLLPSWAIALYGRSAYPRATALAMLRGMRAAAVLLPDRTPFVGLGPRVLAAVRDLGERARPGADKLP